MHVRHRGESIFELALFGYEVSTFIRRLATDFGLLLENFGSKNSSGWSLRILDTFEVPDGCVVVAQIVVVRQPPLAATAVVRPKKSPRSPKQGRDKEQPEAFQGQGQRPLPRSRPKFGATDGGKTHAVLSNGAGIQHAQQDHGNTVGPSLLGVAEFSAVPL